MKYSDLIQFEPIESVIQLREAEAEPEARRLVDSFVISRRMAEQLNELVFPQLQLDQPAESHGMMIVGNYGTGKSHLMAVLSAVAERADLAPRLSHPRAAEGASKIAGRFKVIRAEIGSTTKSLRDILCDVLEDGLDGLGVTFQFPSADERHENKAAFQEMMAAFQEEHSGHGLLLVLDELLDYLRTRKDQELSLDLSFLREIGELCKGTRFRFVAGLQESLFDNPRFQFVADTLRRVKDRFEQVRIAREDVAHVVAERLLTKSAEQQARIREHLTAFTPLFGSMNERLEDFVRLFPVHPSYLETFERVYVAEKREVLKTLSTAIRQIVDREVPAEEPGLIAYDSYWLFLRENPSFRSIPEIKEVIDKSAVLEARIEQAFTRPRYRPAALRAIHALAVHRLTTSDIYAPLGATAEELRDDLCLLLPALPERDAEFLKTMVETVLEEIIKTVSGQFLSHNRENGQYYLDLKKDVDFDSLIGKKAESIDDDLLDRYYFDALLQVVLGDPEKRPYVTGYRIWEHELVWRERNAGRSGYLFFGAPSQRSTAQPPRDFYLYFIQPFATPYFKDEKKADEVFFWLEHRDESFERTLKLYAGAMEQAAAASGANKRIYESKAQEHLRTLTAWLREHLPTALEVGYEGRVRPLAEVVQGRIPGGLGRVTVGDSISIAGAACLAPKFAEDAPEYPRFSVTITRNNRQQATQEALRWIGGGVKSKPATAVLDALELLDGERLRPRESRYARHVLELMAKKGQGQVVNRSELLIDREGVESWERFRLEPEFLAVVVASLVHSGDVVVSLPGKKLDAAALDRLARLPIAELMNFKHLERPRDLPLGALRELLDLLDLPQGLIVDPARREEAVAQLQGRVASLIQETVLVQSELAGSGLVLWGQPILAERERSDWPQRLANHKEFLESLQPYNTEGKLKGFPYGSAEIAAERAGRDLVREIRALIDLVGELGLEVSYLGKAEMVFDTEHPLVERMGQRREELLSAMRTAKRRSEPTFRREVERALAALEEEHQQAYLAEHRRARLGVAEERRKAALERDPRLAQIRQLATIEMMPAQQCRDLEDRLAGLKSCPGLVKNELDADPICPHCHFRPAEEPARGDASAVLDEIDERLDLLVRDWTATLRDNLEAPDVAANIELLGDPRGKSAIARFLEEEELPEPLEPALLEALRDVLAGLEKVVLERDMLHAALVKGGLPCTVENLQDRFARHLADLLRGKDADRVRIVVE